MLELRGADLSHLDFAKKNTFKYWQKISKHALDLHFVYYNGKSEKYIATDCTLFTVRDIVFGTGRASF